MSRYQADDGVRAGHDVLLCVKESRSEYDDVDCGAAQGQKYVAHKPRGAYRSAGLVM
jgi:hypothetical protein